MSEIMSMRRPKAPHIYWKETPELMCLKELAYCVFLLELHKRHDEPQLWARCEGLIEHITERVLHRRVSLQEICEYVKRSRPGCEITPHILMDRADKAERKSEFNKFHNAVGTAFLECTSADLAGLEVAIDTFKWIGIGPLPQGEGTEMKRKSTGLKASEIYGESQGNPELLKASMLPPLMNRIIIVADHFRMHTFESGGRKLMIDLHYPKFRSEYAKRLEGGAALQAVSWAVNRTNFDRLTAFLTADDFDELLDARIWLERTKEGGLLVYAVKKRGQLTFAHYEEIDEENPEAAF